MAVPTIVLVMPLLILGMAAFGVATGFALGWGQEYAMQRLRRHYAEQSERGPVVSDMGKAWIAGHVDAETYFGWARERAAVAAERNVRRRTGSRG